jgi:hypothetical protein
MIELNRLEIAGYQILEMLAVPRDQKIQPFELQTLQLPTDTKLN